MTKYGIFIWKFRIFVLSLQRNFGGLTIDISQWGVNLGVDVIAGWTPAYPVGIDD